jgi:hypothetical protein
MLARRLRQIPKLKTSVIRELMRPEVPVCSRPCIIKLASFLQDSGATRFADLQCKKYEPANFTVPSAGR